MGYSVGMNFMLQYHKTKIYTFHLNFYNFYRSNKKTRAYEIDFFDPDSQAAIAGVFLGLILGVGVPIFYASRDEADERRLEEIRSLSRSTKEATGEYMSDEEIRAM